MRLPVGSALLIGAFWASQPRPPTDLRVGEILCAEALRIAQVHLAGTRHRAPACVDPMVMDWGLFFDIALVLYGTWAFTLWPPSLWRYWRRSTFAEKCLASFGLACSTAGCVGAWALLIYRLRGL